MSHLNAEIPEYLGGYDLDSPLSSFSFVISFDFSSIDFSGLTYEDVLEYIPAEYLTAELETAIRKILSGDLSDVYAAQDFLRSLYDEYGPDVTLGEALDRAGYGGDPEPEPETPVVDGDIDDRWFDLDERFDFTDAQSIAEGIKSRLYEIASDGSWFVEGDDILQDEFGGAGDLREQLFDEIGSQAFEVVKDTIADKLGGGVGDLADAVRDSLDVKRIVSDFVGNLMNQLEEGFDAISGKTDMTVEEYDNRLRENVGGFYDDAGEFLDDKIDGGKSIIDQLRGFAFGTQEVNSFQATIFEGKTIIGVDKSDVILGSIRSETIQTKGGDDIVFGASGADRISLGSGDDFVNAGRQNDIVRGEAGADTIVGGAGRDVLYGDGRREYADVFMFRAAEDSGVGLKKRDLIADFDRKDVIDLSGLAESEGVDLQLMSSARFNGDEGAMVVVRTNRPGVKNDSTVLKIDLDGDRVAEFEIGFVGLKTFSEDSILV